MENENVTTDDGQDAAQIIAQGLEDSLRSLRARLYEPQNAWPTSEQEELSEEEDDDAEQHDLEEDSELDDADVHEVEEEAHSVFSEAFEDLHEEVRRMGREMFRTNRTTERNQELFDEAIHEIRQLSATVALIPAQHEEAISAARFETKAELCRELVRMADAFAASLAAVNDLIRQLEGKASSPQRGLVFRFSAARELGDSLFQSVAAMKQWRDGQQLLAERLESTLRSAGARQIETQGRAFDPEQHRAVSAEVRHDVAPGTIIGEELKGYTLEGRVLRYPEVIVSKHE